MRLINALRRFGPLGLALSVLLSGIASVALPAASASASSLQFQLDPGDYLGVANSIISPDNQYWLTMDPDGNVRETQLGGNLHIASTHTSGHDGAILKMQTDGNLVVIAPGNVPIWASGTNDYPGTVLQIQDDGALVLYAPGHQVLKVLVPQLFDPNNSVATPVPQPLAEAPGVDPSEVTQAVYDGSKVLGCATAGHIVEEFPDGGAAAGAFMDQTCGMAAEGDGANLDGYGVFRIGSSVVIGLVSAGAGVAWDILSDTEDAD